MALAEQPAPVGDLEDDEQDGEGDRDRPHRDGDLLADRVGEDAGARRAGEGGDQQCLRGPDPTGGEGQRAGDRTPVLVISAYRYAYEPKEALEMGADGCVEKPVDWEALVEKIEALTT